MKLAKRWSIDLRKARKTVKQTTQKALRTTVYSSLPRRYRINNRILGYNCLLHRVFSDYHAIMCNIQAWEQVCPSLLHSVWLDLLSSHNSQL